MSYLPNIQPQQLTANASISTGQIVQIISGQIVPATSSFNTAFLGIALSSASTNETVLIQSTGVLNSSIHNLGDGYACAVGVNSSGVPVRSVDSTCVSPGNWLGTCDAFGNITIAPYHTTELNIIDYGAISGDSSASARLQNNGAITAAMRATSLISVSGINSGNQSAAVIKVPSGDWYFAQTVDITRPIQLLGVKGKFFPGARFFIPDGYIGIHIWQGSGQTGFPDVTDASGSGAVVEGIYLLAETVYNGAPEGAAGSFTAYGIFMNALSHVSHCVIENFGGHGLYIASENNGFPDNWQVDWTRVSFCQDGIHIVGGDANNGVCNHGDFQGNRGWGVFGHSFLGDSFIECHTAENAGGAYNIYAVGETTLINCYSEGDQPPSQMSGNVFVIGGLHGAAFTGNSSFFGGTNSNAIYPTGFLGKPITNIPLTGVRIWQPGLTILDGYTITVVIAETTIPVTNYIYQAQNGGTTGATTPNFPFTVGQTINDNGIIWKNVGIVPSISANTSDEPSSLSYIIQIVTPGYPGGYNSYFPYNSQDANILQIRYSTDSGVTWIYFIPSRADYAYDFGLSLHQLGFSNIHTTVTASSDGATLPQSIINVASTVGFVSGSVSRPGTLLLHSTSGLQSISYTGTTASSFTGCTGGSGTIHTNYDGYQGGSGTFIYFTPTFYYTDNAWSGNTDGGITTQFMAGSNDGTLSAYGWGHYLSGDTVTDPRIDAGSPWRVIYNLTTGRWNQIYANSYVSKEWVGSRSLPLPGSELFDGGLMSAQQPVGTGVTDGYGGWNRIGWYDASQTYGTPLWRDYCTAPSIEWFQPGTLFLNRAGTGNNYPVAIRSVQQGGWGITAYSFDTLWSSGLSISVGETIYPSSQNNPAYGYVFRANSAGVTQSIEPTWPTVLGNTVQDGLINWQNVGTLDGYGSNPNTFEPFGIASPLKLTKDCSAGGTITLSFAEISHERYILTGSPGAAFTVIIGVGAGDSWNRVLYNSTAQSVTVAASGGDAGTVVLSGKALHLLHTGTNIIEVGS